MGRGAVALAALAAGSGAMDFPKGMLGTWEVAPDWTIIGPLKAPISWMLGELGSDGFYIADKFAPQGLIPDSWQRWYVINDHIVYCGHLYNYALPHAVAADVQRPLKLQRQRTSDVNSLVFCLDKLHAPIPKLPSDCSGCGCMQYSILLRNDTLHVEMLMASPIVHARMEFRRVAPAPEPLPAPVPSTWLFRCNFSQPQPDVPAPAPPRHLPSAEPRCPMIQHREHSLPVASPAAGSQCVLLNIRYGVRLSWQLEGATASVQLTIDAAAAGDYIALAFKAGFQTGEHTHYGMAGGEVLLGYAAQGGSGCVRRMLAESYVGLPVDSNSSAPYATDAALTVAGGRQALTFGVPAANLTSLPGRVMWAVGKPGADCAAPPSYHSLARGFSVNPLALADPWSVVAPSRRC